MSGASFTAQHTAAFAGTDGYLPERIATFIADGLAADDRILVLATMPTWGVVTRHLEDAGVSYGRASAEGRLLLIDAEDVLERVTEHGPVDVDLFRSIIEPLLTPSTSWRVYGELVSLLAARGDIAGALEIETLGQTLSRNRGIEVLCGYRREGLTPDALTALQGAHDRSLLEGEHLAPLPEADGPLHAVRFYRDSQTLAALVARFLTEGLAGGAAAVVIATEEHRDAIAAALTTHYFDPMRLQQSGDLVFADAESLLDQFMLDGMPDPRRFRETVEPILERAAHRRDGMTRAYGEMVDILWKREQTEAAVRLETLWNQLAQTHAFGLLCGYSIGHFYKQSERRALMQLHTHVVSDTGALSHAR